MRSNELWAEIDRAYMDFVAASSKDPKVFEEAKGVLLDRLFQAVDYLLEKDVKNAED